MAMFTLLSFLDQKAVMPTTHAANDHTHKDERTVLFHHHWVNVH